MSATQTNEFDIEFPASEIWNVYGTLVLPEVVKSIPNLLKDIHVTRDDLWEQSLTIICFQVSSIIW